MQSIIAEKRTILGKKTYTLRKQGLLLAVLYGKKKASESISVKETDFIKLWKSAGESSVVEVKIGKESYNALLQDVATDPLRGKPVHADFYVVEMDKPIKVDVQLEFIGESEAVRAGGILVKVMHEIKIEALPKDLPHSIPVDISSLKTIDGKIAVRDLKVPAGVKVLGDSEDTVILVEAPRTEEELKGETEAAAADLGAIEVVGKKAKEEGAEEEGREEKGKKEEKGKTEKKKEAKA